MKLKSVLKLKRILNLYASTIIALFVVFIFYFCVSTYLIIKLNKTMHGDVNLDNVVDSEDFAIMLQNWGER